MFELSEITLCEIFAISDSRLCETRNESVDLVGLTLSRDCPSSAIVTLIRSMRAESANPHLKVLIGGRMVNSNPAIVAEVGADGTGADARAALDAAERLVRSPAVRVPSAK